MSNIQEGVQIRYPSIPGDGSSVDWRQTLEIVQ